MLQACSRFPDELRKARLSFAQKRVLALAVCGSPDKDHLGGFIDGVNALRNRLAHDADVPDLALRVDTLLSGFYGDDFEPPETEAQRATMLKNAFAFACGALSGEARILRAIRTSFPT